MSPAPNVKSRIELEKAFAHDVFRQTPKEVLDEFGPMVLERVFPELQIDDKYLQFLIESGEDYELISNVTQENIPISQLNDHWIFPGGVQISKSTGAIYFPKKSRHNKKVYMSILESKFEDLVNVVDMDTIKHPKDRLIMKVTIKTNTTTTTELETNDGMSLMFAKEEKITTLVFESPEPEPSKLDDAFVVVETSGESKLPNPMSGHEHSIKDRLYNQIGHLTKEDEITSPDHLLERFNPVLISQDLVIFENTNPESEYKYVAFAKLKDKKEEKPKHFWQLKKIHKNSNVPAEKTKWLAGLEKKNHKGGFLSGFNTAALTV